MLHFTLVFQYSWYFFEALVKSMAQYLMESGKVKVSTIIWLNKLSFYCTFTSLLYHKISMITIIFAKISWLKQWKRTRLLS